MCVCLLVTCLWIINFKADSFSKWVIILCLHQLSPFWMPSFSSGGLHVSRRACTQSEWAGPHCRCNYEASWLLVLQRQLLRGNVSTVLSMKPMNFFFVLFRKTHIRSVLHFIGCPLCECRKLYRQSVGLPVKIALILKVKWLMLVIKVLQIFVKCINLQKMCSAE